MTKLTQHSFLGGQLDWEMMGRQDVEKYRSGASLLKNVVLHKRGAAFKRPGTNYINQVTGYVANNHYRLVPFASTTTQGFALILTDNGIRAVSSSGVIWVNVPSGFTYYSGDELKELDYCQCGDVVYIAHRNHPPCKIEHTVSGSTHTFTLTIINLNQQNSGKPTVASASVSKTGISTKGPSYTEEYKVTAVWNGVETYPSDAYSNDNCQDYDPTYAEVQSWNSFASTYPDWATANKVYPKTYIAPCKSYTGTAYTLPWTESQKITLTINVPTIGGNRPEQIRVYRKTGSFFGLVGVIDTASDRWKSPSYTNTVSATTTRIKYNGTANKGNAINKKTYDFGRFGLGGDGFNVTGAISLTLGSAAHKATVNLKIGHISYLESTIADPYPAWNETTTYNAGDTCKYSSVKYYCLYDGTVGEIPSSSSSLWKSTTVSKLIQRVYTYTPCGATRFTVRLGTGDQVVADVSCSSSNITQTYSQSPAETTANFRTRAESEASTWANSLEDSDELSVEVRATTASTALTVTPNTASFVMNNVTTSSSAKESNASTVKWEDKYYTPDVSVTPPSVTDVMQSTSNYPGCVCLSQQRLIWASTANDPSRVFMSEIGAFYTYAPHDVMIPDDPIDFNVSATQFPRVNHIAELRKIILFNGASEWIVDSASANSGITFETIRATQHSCIGSSPTLKPLVCNNVLLFAERTGQAVRQYGYELEDDGFGGNDISVFAQSIFKEKKIVAWAYQQYPNSTCWCVLSDGTLASLTFNREQQCIAWATHVIGGGGLAKDIVCTQAVIGNDANLLDTSEILILVKRGNDYIIEQMRPEPKDEQDTPANFVCMDAVKTVSGTGYRRSGTTLVDLSTMQIASTGVSGRTYAEGYAFDTRIRTVYPVVSDAVGMSQMDVKCVQYANLRLMRAVGGKVKTVDTLDAVATPLVKTTFSYNTSTQTATILPVDERVILPASETRDGRIEIFNDGPLTFGVIMVETDIETEENR